MDIKITTNFSFSKLSSNLDKIINQYTESFVKDSAEGTKQKIDKVVKPDINDITKNIRTKRKQRKTPPLKASGALYNSIKQNKNSLEMLYYGFKHQKGFTTSSNSMIPNKKVEARPFITTTAKNKEKLNKKFIQDVNKALKK
jgi:phage gpG-like protein